MSHHPESIRLNKAISDNGYCSRRQADQLITQGVVTVNDQVAQLGDRVMPGEVIKINGTPLTPPSEDVYIMLNKPVGITCTTDRKIKGNVVDFIKHPQRIFHVGRLDKPSEGLLLMTNNGDIVNKILRAGNLHEKEYIVHVNRPISENFLKRMRQGIPILDTVTKPCQVERLSRTAFKIILVQGLNRQIRRMCEYLEYDVVRLNRVRLMHLHLGDLPLGQWRDLTQKEVNELKTTIASSDNSPFVDHDNN
ncbi:MAG: 23S rRNA pseudouridine(2604) synthase RluF [Flavobacteriaceae bacterium]|jgi:23S rRNA pseudouridine2604 synthase|nr:23S rRNA pseudouridine(2604) synthase RluF [Flavobacteriaceae bacterium]MDC0637210.1 23S rRNA pseudouridine(2604) synthase RluF [Flavobacteriaceae bacterium]MDG1063641.1 23S rRNA pseudouridine(2604) synthase RluF [Flavobacteriaceae bacterium]MDG1962056.1 23S rRNA pseudouridine(2604) synthase RluF [Flavobacteriaceae bacterium]